MTDPVAAKGLVDEFITQLESISTQTNLQNVQKTEYKMKKSTYTTTSGNIQYIVYRAPVHKTKGIKFVSESPKRKTWTENDAVIFEKAYIKLEAIKAKVYFFQSFSKSQSRQLPKICTAK
jgi:hypothetical protein